MDTFSCFSYLYIYNFLTLFLAQRCIRTLFNAIVSIVLLTKKENVP